MLKHRPAQEKLLVFLQMDVAFPIYHVEHRPNLTGTPKAYAPKGKSMCSLCTTLIMDWTQAVLVGKINLGVCYGWTGAWQNPGKRNWRKYEAWDFSKRTQVQ